MGDSALLGHRGLDVLAGFPILGGHSTGDRPLFPLLFGDLDIDQDVAKAVEPSLQQEGDIQDAGLAGPGSILQRGLHFPAYLGMNQFFEKLPLGFPGENEACQRFPLHSPLLVEDLGAETLHEGVPHLGGSQERLGDPIRVDPTEALVLEGPGDGGLAAGDPSEKSQHDGLLRGWRRRRSEF